jgi:hypothetical protein
VSLVQGFGFAQAPGAVYEVVALLPSDTAHFQYRIRSATEAFARVAAENQLAPSGGAPAAAAPRPMAATANSIAAAGRPRRKSVR